MNRPAPTLGTRNPELGTRGPRPGARSSCPGQGWRRFFAEFDAVVCPVSPTPAFPHDHYPDPLRRRLDIDGVAYPYFDQLVWAGVATMPGLPATAVPAGRSPEGLPVGVQLIGPMYEDRTPLKPAELLEQRIGGFRAPARQGGGRVA